MFLFQATVDCLSLSLSVFGLTVTGEFLRQLWDIENSQNMLHKNPLWFEMKVHYVCICFVARNIKIFCIYLFIFETEGPESLRMENLGWNKLCSWDIEIKLGQKKFIFLIQTPFHLCICTSRSCMWKIWVVEKSLEGGHWD